MGEEMIDHELSLCDCEACRQYNNQPTKTTSDTTFEIVSMEDTPDGGAVMKLNISPDALKQLASIGILTVISDACDEQKAKDNVTSKN